LKYQLNVAPQIKMTDELIQKTWHLPVYVDFAGDVDESSAKNFIDSLKAAENAALACGQEIIPITINSFGGCAYSMLGMVDAIKSCSVKVATIVESKAMSAGALLFSCGAEGHRYIGPNATIMIHTVASAARGKVEEIKASTEQSEHLARAYFRIMAENCDQHTEYFQEIVQKEHINADWYLTPDEAKKHNLANVVGIPTLKVDVEMSHTFGLDE
jgi:ATP-dependent Clp endopeptidase proteolytic subunit ClpP